MKGRLVNVTVPQWKWLYLLSWKWHTLNEAFIPINCKTLNDTVFLSRIFRSQIKLQRATKNLSVQSKINFKHGTEKRLYLFMLVSNTSNRVLKYSVESIFLKWFCLVLCRQSLANQIRPPKILHSVEFGRKQPCTRTKYSRVTSSSAKLLPFASCWWRTWRYFCYRSTLKIWWKKRYSTLHIHFNTIRHL